MAYFDGLFSALKSPVKQAEPVKQKGGYFPDLFSGQPAAKPATTTPVYKPIFSKVTTHRMSPSLGGGEFNLPANKLVTSTRSQEPIGPTRKGTERDHIISVALGGTSSKENLQYLEDNKSWINKILGRETTFEERQQGKIVVEQEVIKDFQSGKLSLAEARGKLLQKQREIQGLDPKQGIKPYIVPAVKETMQKGGEKLFEGLFGEQSDVKPTMSDTKSSTPSFVLSKPTAKPPVSEKPAEPTEPKQKFSLDKWLQDNFSLDNTTEKFKQLSEDKKLAKQVTNYLLTNKKISEGDYKKIITGQDMARPLTQEEQFLTTFHKEDLERKQNMALGATMPLEDLGAQAIKAIEGKLGKILSAAEKDHVFNFLKKERAAGNAMVKVTPEGPVFEKMLSEVEKKAPAEIAAPIEVPKNKPATIIQPAPAKPIFDDIPFESVNPERAKQIQQYKTAKEFENSFSNISPEMDQGTIPKIAAANENVGKKVFSKLGQPSKVPGMTSVQEILQNKSRAKPESMSIEMAYSEKGMEQARKYVDNKYTKNEYRGFADSTNDLNKALREKPGFLHRVKQFTSPIKNQDPKVQDIFKQWTRKKLIGRELANAEIPKLEIPNNEGWDIIKEYEKGGETPYSRDIRKTFDDLIKEARKRGLEVPYRDNYLPHVYDNTQEEIKTAMSKYMIDKGVDAKTVEDYIEGIKDLPEEIVRNLKLNPSFIKHRAFPDYETAAKYGLRPKYTNPAQLVAHYRNDLEQTIANNEFLNGLINQGKIFPFEVAPRGYVAVNIPFSGGGYMAEPKLAELLNGIFRDDNNLNLGQWSVKQGAWLSKKMQEIALSAGIPKTQFNFFSIGQLIKELTAGNVGAFRTYARANFNGATARYFEDNVDVLKEMAAEGLDLGGRIGSYGKVFENLQREKGFIKWFGRGWERWFNEKPFGSLLPQLYTETFKNAKNRFISKGMGAKEAKAAAADVVRNFYGVFEDVGRGKTNEDVISSLMFAPKFREGIINSLWNVGRSGVDFVSSGAGFRRPLNPALYKNRRLLIGMILAFAGYNALNKKLTGHYMWDNPSGKEFELMIPTKNENGDVVYIAFMPSYLAFARNMLSGVIATGTGHFDVAKQKFGSLASMPIKLITELWANQDYFGRQIWKDSDNTRTKLWEAVKHSGLQVTHPFLKEAYKWLFDDKPGYQALSEAMEMPAKFSTMDKINLSRFIDAEKEQKAREKKETNRIQPIYEKAQKLLAAGKEQEAKDLWAALSEEDKAIYKTIKKKDQSNKKSEAKKQAIANMLPLVEKLQEMKKDGREQEAFDIWNNLSDDDKGIYAETKKSAGL